MKTVQASEAKTHFLRLLDEVERGESIVITRRGKPVARIMPDSQHNTERARRAAAAIRALRAQTKPVSIEEILSARDEGRE